MITSFLAIFPCESCATTRILFLPSKFVKSKLKFQLFVPVAVPNSPLSVDQVTLLICPPADPLTTTFGFCVVCGGLGEDIVIEGELESLTTISSWSEEDKPLSSYTTKEAV